MTKFDLSALHNNAVPVFKTLCQSPELVGFTLVGGNALALQIQHRISLNFCFACYEQKLPTRQIDDFISRLKQQGHAIHDVTDTTTVAQFKINTGENLRDYNRDYVLDGVMLTLFVLGKTQQQREFYRHCDTLQKTDTKFKIMALDGLKVAKTLLLADRVRSRDLFDLKILVEQHAFTLEKMNLFIKTLGHIDDPEHYRAILTGIIPLDICDEGVTSLYTKFDINSIYQYFEQIYTESDIQKAADFYSKKNQP